MKFLIVLVSFIVLSNALNQELKDSFLKEMQEHGMKCMEEIHPTDDDIAELLGHKLPPTSHEAKCMFFCMQKSFKMMNEDGTPNKEGTMELLAPLKDDDPDMYEKFANIFETCMSSFVKDDDPCVSSVNWVSCGMEQAKKVGIPEDLLGM